MQFGRIRAAEPNLKLSNPLFNRDTLSKVDIWPPCPAKSIELDEGFPKRHSSPSLDP